MEYSTGFLDAREIFSPSEVEFLFSLAQEYPYEEFLRDRRSFEERSIDYAYVSSKIEGNLYSRKGASMLLQYGFTEAGMTYEDATMLVNLRELAPHRQSAPENLFHNPRFNSLKEKRDATQD